MLNTRTRRIHVFLKCLCLLLTMAMINGCMGGGKGGKDFTLSVNIVGRGSGIFLTLVIRLLHKLW